MSERPTVQKAKIVSVSDASKSVTCHFNPDTFSMDRTISWKPSENIGGDASTLYFGGGQASDLTMTFLFDTTDTGNDVRDTYQTLIDLSKVDPNKKNAKTGKGEPSLCRFEWGRFLTFTAAITQLSQTFTMFKADGTPLRAEVKVTFKQVEEACTPAKSHHAHRVAQSVGGAGRADVGLDCVSGVRRFGLLAAHRRDEQPG